MGMSEFYGAQNDAESLATIDRSLELGMNFLDTADVYGYGDNEFLVARPFAAAARRSFSPQNSALSATRPIPASAGQRAPPLMFAPPAMPASGASA